MHSQLPMNYLLRGSVQMKPMPRRAFLPTGLAAITLILAGMALITPAGWGKEKKPPSRTLSGLVLDEEGNTIEGASVELTDLQTNKVIAVYSQEEGQYQFTDLNFSHDYKVKATFKGASSEVRQISSLDSRPRYVRNLKIPTKKQ